MDLGSTGGLRQEAPHMSNTDMKLLPMQTKSLPIKHPRGLSYDVQLR